MQIRKECEREKSDCRGETARYLNSFFFFCVETHRKINCSQWMAAIECMIWHLAEIATRKKNGYGAKIDKKT